eukprot:Gb_13287 [translate_table: standard]
MDNSDPVGCARLEQDYTAFRISPPDSEDDELNEKDKLKYKNGRNPRRVDFCKLQRYCLAGVIFMFIALVCYLAMRGD